MNIQYSRGLIKWIYGLVQHYNPEKYWKYREYVITGGGYAFSNISVCFI